MAIRNARLFRPLLAVLAVGATVVVAPGIASAAPHRDPSVTDVQKTLAKLSLENSGLVEKYDQSRLVATKTQKAATAAKAKANSVGRSYETARTQFVQLVQNQYEANALGAAGALLESDSGSDYLDRIDSLGIMSTHVSQVVDRIDKARKTADAAAAKAQKLYATAKKSRDALAAERKTVNTKIKKYQALLSTLNSAARSAYLRAQNPSVSVSKVHLTKAGSAAARRAVDFAIAQIGKPYVFGAAGPGSYDCSGLTMRSWQQGGVSLPHSAAGQYSYGHHVSISDLEPGDLVFMYQPISHVTIYAGNGMMVSAPTEGQPVTLVPVTAFSSDIVGATRLS